jgi:hypothetical protein
MTTRASKRKADGGAAESVGGAAESDGGAAESDGGTAESDSKTLDQMHTELPAAKVLEPSGQASAQLTAPSEDFSESIRKANDDAMLARGQLAVERQLRAAELDRHRKQWEMRLNEELERERAAHSSVFKQLEKVRSELTLSNKRVQDLEGRNVMCMDAEALFEIREVLQNSLSHVKGREERIACLPDVLGIMPEAACPITKKCMIFPVKAADGNTYEKEAIEKYMEAAGENATSPLTGEKLESRDLEINWAMRKGIYDAGTKVLLLNSRAFFSFSPCNHFINK